MVRRTRWTNRRQNGCTDDKVDVWTAEQMYRPHATEWAHRQQNGFVQTLKQTYRRQNWVFSLFIFLYSANPSFETAKWMAQHMPLQNMKIIKILQNT